MSFFPPVKFFRFTAKYELGFSHKFYHLISWWHQLALTIQVKQIHFDDNVRLDSVDQRFCAKNFKIYVKFIILCGHCYRPSIHDRVTVELLRHRLNQTLHFITHPFRAKFVIIFDICIDLS